MIRRSGSADLPLHGGAVPTWLAVRMTRMARLIAEAIVLQFGRDELLRRLAHPFWFQSFGALMGMDWHSSGITTSVLAALKRGLAPLEQELGIYVCGGKGAHSRRTPAELCAFGEATGQDPAALLRASRLIAKIDHAAVQDGFSLYLHTFIATPEGHWCVVQQGMNAGSRAARRYHWQSENLRDFFDSPHAAIEGANVGVIVNLADVRALQSRTAGLELVREGPTRALSVLRRFGRAETAALPLFPDIEELPAAPLPHLVMPPHHEIRASDLLLKRLQGTLAAAAEADPKDYADLLLTPGVGARTVQALAFVAELLYGAPSRFSDPARFALAHGGKDGHPFPVPLAVFDQTLSVLKSAVRRARLGAVEELAALKRLDAQARLLEKCAPEVDFQVHLARERAASGARGGRTVRS